MLLFQMDFNGCHPSRQDDDPVTLNQSKTFVFIRRQFDYIILGEDSQADVPIVMGSYDMDDRGEGIRFVELHDGLRRYNQDAGCAELVG